MFGLFGKKPIDEVKQSQYLFGVSMRDYHYLGHGVCRYVEDVSDPSSKVKAEQFIHFFVNKLNYKDRVYKVIPCNAQNGASFKGHSYIVHDCPIWAAGEHDLCWPVNHKPSDWLTEYMKQNGYVWNTETNWWLLEGEPAPVKAKAKKKAIKKEDNVVTVDFTKKEDDNEGR